MMERFQPSPTPIERAKKEKTFYEKIDASFRDKDTAFAHLLEAISPEKGEEYLNGKLKRFLDLSIAVPAVVISTPVVAVLGIVKKLEDGGSAFFVQERYQTIPQENKEDAKTFRIWKIRSMVEGAEKDASRVLKRGVDEKLDPRQTKLGKTLRRYKFDELPQFFHVISGKLSAIGARPLPPSSVRVLNGSSEGKEPSSLFHEWVSAYNKGKKGLTGLQQVRGTEKRMSGERFHSDIFYTKNASLGLDLYLLWATIGRILGTYPRRKSRTKEVKE